MRKYILILTIFALFTATQSYAQWEFQYFTLRAGANHNALSAQPTYYSRLFLTTPDGMMKAKPSAQYIDYVPGVNAGLFFHWDFESDKGGLVIGGEIANLGFQSKYETYEEKEYRNGDIVDPSPVLEKANYSCIRTYRLTTFSIPVMLKFGREIYQDQQYMYVGGQYNMNLSLKTIDQGSWSTTKSIVKGTPDEIIKSNLVFFIGYNYSIFNIQLDYMMKNFLNPEFVYVDKISTAKYKPYGNQPQNLFYLKTSINLPLSEWTTKRYYFMYKLWRKIRFWR